MDYVRLGRAGVKVSRLCLGTAFRGYWHGHTDEATAVRTVETAIDLGAIFSTAPTSTFRAVARNCWARPSRASATIW